MSNKNIKASPENLWPPQPLFPPTPTTLMPLCPLSMCHTPLTVSLGSLPLPTPHSPPSILHLTSSVAPSSASSSSSRALNLMTKVRRTGRCPKSARSWRSQGTRRLADERPAGSALDVLMLLLLLLLMSMASRRNKTKDVSAPLAALHKQRHVYLHLCKLLFN